MKQTVLVIGASGEIGSAIVKELSQQSYQFILHFNENEQAIAQLEKLLNDDQILMTIQADLNEPNNYELINSIPFQVDTIIFAQGKAANGLITETDLDVLDELYHTHVKSTVAISKSFLKSMINRQKGNIIVISSIWGEIGASQEIYYSSVKGAQISFVKALAKEVGQSNIRVNAVSPGLIQTKMNKHLNNEELDDFFEDVPFKRAGTTDEVAKVVSFLCSTDSSYIHGQVIRVNGGQLT
ncbi:elongation factor P 5-aminopentanone reductase [Piscibacillus sp. B03]|uniref:elongation factor P 5-aminopentanone reductase n=1 Tax=Piscibacillus sp. B03 TaxID=3457430 RepID=UPI003FCC9F84